MMHPSSTKPIEEIEATTSQLQALTLKIKQTPQTMHGTSTAGNATAKHTREQELEVSENIVLVHGMMLVFIWSL